MAVYGKAQDVLANQGRGVNLYIPGKTQFNQGDVFLGGTGTGVTDEQLNGAQRVFGNTAEDTASAYGGFLKGSQSQARPQQQSQFKLPPGARPGLAMRTQMAQESQWDKDFNYREKQNNFDNEMKTKTFDWGKAMDEANQKIKVGDMLGNYEGQDTWQKQATLLQNAMAERQFAASMAARSSGGSSGGSRSSSGGAKAITQSSNAGKTNMDDAMIEIQNQLELGTKPGDIAYAIEQQGDILVKQGINVASLLKSVWEMAGIQTKPEQEDSWR